MATEKLVHAYNSVVIATDTTKPTNAALKAQGWTVNAGATVNEPPNGTTAV